MRGQKNEDSFWAELLGEEVSRKLIEEVYEEIRCRRGEQVSLNPGQMSELAGD